MSRVAMEKKVLSENDRIAAELRARFQRDGILCLNFIGSPGAGKTSLLEQTLAGFVPGERVALLTGDIQTDNDARRLARYGFPVRQISTGGTCHLDARMVARALEELSVEPGSMLLIENVGNLVCPASYDLGEASKIVILSAAEGEDKPLKYPSIFFKAELAILNKVDLLPYVPFNLALARENVLRVHPGMEILEVSCTSGVGLEDWRHWLVERWEAVRTGLAARGD